MSILIKGMDMPTQCYDCYLVANDPDGNGLYCKHLKEDIADWCRRLPNCPLVEVKTPHGRLLDENEVKNSFKFTEDAEYARWTLAGVLMEIEDADAVIESED